ncbi:fagellar hook-basal body proteins [Eubacterium sp. CAG:786]|nr:fagellar hook-basal body proteins [Eubacterium sp. CAG:786]
MNLGRIDIATFDNPNGLTAMGGTLFAESVASGQPKLAIAGQDGAGEVVSGALEMSNVDLAQEFTDMITTQRGYQANSRVITTSDTMLEELLSLKR